jgi:hypothetical protein
MATDAANSDLRPSDWKAHPRDAEPEVLRAASAPSPMRAALRGWAVLPAPRH